MDRDFDERDQRVVGGRLQWSARRPMVQFCPDRIYISKLYGVGCLTPALRLPTECRIADSLIDPARSLNAGRSGHGVR